MKMYIIVRRDLPTLSTYGASLSCCCSICESTRNGKNFHKWNDTMVLLTVKDEEELLYWLDELYDLDPEVKGFTEPDRNLEMTAIVAIGNEEMAEATRSLQLFH